MEDEDEGEEFEVDSDLESDYWWEDCEEEEEIVPMSDSPVKRESSSSAQDKQEPATSRGSRKRVCSM